MSGEDLSKSTYRAADIGFKFCPECSKCCVVVYQITERVDCICCEAEWTLEEWGEIGD